MALEDATNPMQGVSGPGKFAKRTDLAYQSEGYGDATAMQQQMQAAPLAKATPTPAATNTQVRQAAQKAVNVEAATSLYAPTQRPDEPITHGVDVGPGMGSSILNLPNKDQAQYQTAYQMIQQWAQNPDASPTLQYLAQRIQQGF